jgi:hypothetical protein
LAVVLAPLGFHRQDDEWRREGEVPQSLRLQRGLPNRTETKFFVQVKLEAKPVGVLLHLPLLPARMAELREQGYVFRAGDCEEALYAAVLRDVARYCQPWFERFTSADEVQRGFEDGTFAPHLRIEDQALVFRPGSA